MGFAVKNTTKFNILDLICPHSCRGCGRLGSLLCECCKKDMESNQKHNFKLAGGSVTAYAERDGLLKDMLKEYKYGPVRAMATPLAELLAQTIPQDQDLVIVPLPTADSHIRARGFDHMDLIAKILAKNTHHQRQKILARRNSTVQVGADAKTRKKQAENAYQVAKTVNPDAHYLLIDDVWTTGASMRAAIKLLKKAGAKHVRGAVLAFEK